MRLIGLVLAVSLILAPLGGEAQTGKVWRIGFLSCAWSLNSSRAAFSSRAS